jgi:predicted nucleotide-binding protein
MQEQPARGVPAAWHAEVFLAYAHEDEGLALAVKSAVETCARSAQAGTVFVTPWPLAIQSLTESTLRNLSDATNCDFGIILYTPAGKTETGNTERWVARDNVVFETGLFIGAKGAERTIILLPEGHEVAPSDLAGIVGVVYPLDDFRKAETVDRRTSILLTSGGRIVERIANVMSQPPAASHPGDGKTSSSAGPPPGPDSPSDLYTTGLRLDASRGHLKPVGENITRGRLVVHALHGIGLVEAFDPPGSQTRYVTVRFGSVTGVYDISDLYLPPGDG